MTQSNSPEPFDPFSTGTGTLSHRDQQFVRKKKRPKIKVEDPAEEDGELNIVPYLDIIMNLIIFLLAIQAVLVSVGMIDVSAPSYASVAPQPGSEPDEQKLKLTLAVAKEGFYIASTGKVLPGEQPAEEGADQAEDAPVAPTIPLKADGTYDFAALARKLRTIKNVFPKNDAVFLSADRQVPYAVIVKTLDAAREDAKGPLFPAVAFAEIR
jgi:biopolymer transport protein ExbD